MIIDQSSFSSVATQDQMSLIELLPLRARAATTCPPGDLPWTRQSWGSLSHDWLLHHRSCSLSLLAAVDLHRRSAEAPRLAATATVNVMQVLCAASYQRNQCPLSHAATALSCRNASISIIFPHNSLYLRLTLGCKRQHYSSLTKKNNETFTFYYAS